MRFGSKIKNIALCFGVFKSTDHTINTILNQEEWFLLLSIAKNFKLIGIFLQFLNKIKNNSVTHSTSHYIGIPKHTYFNAKEMAISTKQTLTSKFARTIQVDWQ